jgi:hypothetical protein
VYEPGGPARLPTRGNSGERRPRPGHVVHVFRWHCARQILAIFLCGRTSTHVQSATNLSTVETTRIVYASIARSGLSYRDVSELVCAAARRNRGDGISGILALVDQTFVQAIEGETTGVSALFQRIEADPRHSGIVLLGRTTIVRRSFGPWPMRLIRWSGVLTTARRKRLLHHFRMLTLKPEALSAQSALEFLEDLSETEVGAEHFTGLP